MVNEGLTVEVTPVVTPRWATDPRYVTNYVLVATHITSGASINATSNRVDAADFLVRETYSCERRSCLGFARPHVALLCRLQVFLRHLSLYNKALVRFAIHFRAQAGLIWLEVRSVCYTVVKVVHNIRG